MPGGLTGLSALTGLSGMAGGAATPYVFPTPTNDWLMNDGAGTTAVDAKLLADITFSNAPTWGAGFATYGDTTTDSWETPNGTGSVANNFTYNFWVTLPTVNATTRYICAIGNGTAISAANNTMYMRYDNTALVWNIANATTGTGGTVNIGFAPAAATLLMIMLRYTRGVSANDSIMTFSYTTNGTFTTVTKTDALLFNANAAFEFRAKPIATGTHQAHTTIHRMTRWDNQLLSDTDRGRIWAAGSESAAY